MKKFSLLLLLFGSFLFAEVRDLDIASFEKLRSNGISVIDIRTPKEWKTTGLIEGSHPIMFFDAKGKYDLQAFLEKLRGLGIDKQKPFILVCRSASRTRMLGNYLSDEMGYRYVYQLAGGILNWKRHNKPLIPFMP
ncbi:rhodanese-like domain-containing protein [Hydrogenimonas urashimensis]|uniref:rhodanese-like domain-containing protein n=1 Tax=Hydrogenimonas urashimensis TaxID=2740515 RepID=UPI0019161EE3|nr:rhodanese-like domain-containing protein [Hydrogenimonas urashimensis]